MQLRDAKLSAPLENVPSLYETWGTLEVINTLLQVGVQAGFIVQREQLISRTPGQVWITILHNGEAAELAHPISRRTVRLVPQRTYGTTSLGLHTVSFRQRPDVAIEITDPGGDTSIYLLDPKYKLDSEDTAEGATASESPRNATSTRCTLTATPFEVAHRSVPCGSRRFSTPDRRSITTPAWPPPTHSPPIRSHSAMPRDDS